MADETITDTLNALISICKDNLDYSVEACSDDTLRPYLEALAGHWQQIIQALRTEVIYWEGVPTESGTLAGEVHWLYAKVKAVWSANERKTILAELEQLSSRALLKFQEALSKNLPLEPRSIIQLQQGQVSVINERLHQIQAMLA